MTLVRVPNAGPLMTNRPVSAKEGTIMRLNWLESKAVSTLLLCSSVVVISLFAFTCLLAIHGVPQFLNSSLAKNPLGILFAVLVVLGIPSVVVLFCCMAIFCACTDRASIRAKALWFALFLLTGPVGSTIYYLAVYRAPVKRQGLPSAAIGQS